MPSSPSIYASNLKAPALTFRDYRLGREVTIENPDTNAVVDAGFDNFVRLQWQGLAEGEEIKFPFRLVDRKDPVKILLCVSFCFSSRQHNFFTCSALAHCATLLFFFFDVLLFLVVFLFFFLSSFFYYCSFIRVFIILLFGLCSS